MVQLLLGHVAQAAEEVGAQRKHHLADVATQAVRLRSHEILRRRSSKSRTNEPLTSHAKYLSGKRFEDFLSRVLRACAETGIRPLPAGRKAVQSEARVQVLLLRKYSLELRVDG